MNGRWPPSKCCPPAVAGGLVALADPLAVGLPAESARRGAAVSAIATAHAMRARAAVANCA